MELTCLSFFRPYGTAGGAIDLDYLGSIFRFDYSYVAQPKYVVSAPLLKTYPAEYKMLCAAKRALRTSRDTMSECIQNEISNQLLALLGSG